MEYFPITGNETIIRRPKIALSVSDEDKKVFQTLLDKVRVLEDKGNTDEVKEVLSSDVKNLDGNKKILLAAYIFEMGFFTDFRYAAFDILASLFKAKIPLKEDEVIELLLYYSNNTWDCEFIGTKAFINQIIKQFPKGGSGKFTVALEDFLKKAEAQEERSMPMKHYLDDVKQKVMDYFAEIKK